MAGGLLRGAVAGGDRDAAERLVDRTGAGIRPGRFRRQGRHRRCRERYERLAEHLHNCPDLERVYVCRSPEEIHPSLRDPSGRRDRGLPTTGPSWRRSRSRPWPSPRTSDATIFYTSGTTGKPKGCHRHPPQHQQQHLRRRRGGALAAFCVAARRRPARSQPAAEGLVLISVPFFHATGCFAVLNPSLFAGAKLAMIRKWDPDKAMQLIQDERLTQMGGVPTIAWRRSSSTPTATRYDLSSIESRVLMAARLSAPELVRKIKEVWPKSSPGNGWGADRDLGHGDQQLGRGLREAVPTAAVPPVPVTDLKITDFSRRPSIANCR
ncbi:AMP-binding protein [Caulobacter segnis]